MCRWLPEATETSARNFQSNLFISHLDSIGNSVKSRESDYELVCNSILMQLLEMSELLARCCFVKRWLNSQFLSEQLAKSDSWKFSAFYEIGVRNEKCWKKINIFQSKNFHPNDGFFIAAHPSSRRSVAKNEISTNGIGKAKIFYF